MRAPVHGASLPTAPGAQARLSMGVLVLYHGAFRPPDRLMARTQETRESFAIPCSRSSSRCRATGLGAALNQEARRAADEIRKRRQENSRFLLESRTFGVPFPFHEERAGL